MLFTGLLVALEVIGDYDGVFELEAKRRFDELRRHFEQLLRERDEFLGRDRNALRPSRRRAGER